MFFIVFLRKLWYDVKNDKKVMYMNLRRFCAALLAFSLAAALAQMVRADELRYYMGDMPVNAGHNSGYSETASIGSDDLHFGWTLGRFYLTGYTRGPDSLSGGEAVFLKNSSDTVALWFHLEQDLNCLNGNSDLSLEQDKDGCDTYFGIPKTDFGRGTLIIRHIDHQNRPGEPVIFTDYLSSLQTGSDTQVYLFEEGDYEVALDYSVRNAPLNILDYDIFPRVEDYRIFFRFSVRNGNCMVFPFDTDTGAELTNATSTPNGFSLDLARSRYLDIQVKRTIMTYSADGPAEDVRFNRPARDGEQYSQEGIYTITVRNRYTGEETVKTIYVGTDALLRAHVATGIPLDELSRQLDSGAVVGEDGSITPAPPKTNALHIPWVIGSMAVLIIAVLVVALTNRKRSRAYRYNRFWWE